jgi:hypothetical protein
MDCLLISSTPRRPRGLEKEARQPLLQGQAPRAAAPRNQGHIELPRRFAMTASQDSESGTSFDPRERVEGGPIDSVPAPRVTLPPPEWAAPRSVSGLSLEWLSRHSPVARRRGSRAELATLRARLRVASGASDTEGERVAAAALARGLAAYGAELDTATKLARRSLMLGDDPSLREELSSWFAALGEPGLAGATLRPLVELESGERLSRLLTRIAVFLGRHGDARGAAE